MRISFLVRDLCHMGGVVSATQNLAGALAEKHQVEIVCLRKVRDASYFALDDRVRVRALTDLRPHSPVSDLEDPLIEVFPKIYPVDPAEKKPTVSRLAEKRLLHFLDTTDAEVVVSSSPRNTIMLAHARGDYLRVTQEHSMPSIYANYYKFRLFEAYHALDALTALTPEEVRSIGDLVPGVRNRLAVLPNCVPASPVRATGRNKVVVTAGVLKPHKGFTELIEAFAVVAAKRPDWRLRIYGDGPERAKLRRRVDELGVYNTVALMGQAAPVSPEFSKGAIFVLPSRREPFGNVVVEAMAAGLPVIAADADHGPRNIITPGEDGLIVPVGDRDAMAGAILELIEDDERRERMGQAALRKAEHFQEHASRARFEAIIEDARARRALPHEAAVRVDADGSLTVDVGPLPEHARDAELVARRTGDKRGEERLFPMSPEGHAVVPWHGGLPEGRWEFSLRSGPGREVPLTVDGLHCDTRDLLTVALPRPAGGPALELLLPYRGEGDRLSARSVVREEHAETWALEVGPDAAEVEIDHWGTGAGPGAVLEAVPRADAERVLSFPLSVEATGEGTHRMRATVDFGALVREHRQGEAAERVWDVWLRPARDEPRVVVAKLATDVREPMTVYAFPRPVVTGGARSREAARSGRRLFATRGGREPVPEGAPVEIRPYFTGTAQLAFKTVTPGG